MRLLKPLLSRAQNYAHAKNGVNLSGENGLRAN